MQPADDRREALIQSRLEALDLAQKVRLVSGTGFWTVGPEPAAGLGRMVLSDGPAGVRGEVWDERDPSLNIPTPISLAATWNTETVARIARLLAADARRKGVHVLLAPAVNLQRSPAGGRNFEYFSEDPELTSALTVAFVTSLQSFGVAATIKHFVANDSETDRFIVDVEADEATLRELYLAPFDAGVRAGAWAIMAAYNLVGGIPMTEHPMLSDVLRDEWGFDGVIMSDWYAVRSVEASSRSGLDLTMPGPRTPWSIDDALASAITGGRVPIDAVNEKVRRILRLAARVGVLEGVAVESDDPHGLDAPSELRAAAAEGMVLLKNSDGMLPLNADGQTIAVVGPAADAGRTLGGGSATVYPEYVISPLDGIRAAFPHSSITHAPALRFGTRHPLAPWEWFTSGGDAGLDVRFLDASGAIISHEHRRTALFKWLGDFQPGLPRNEVSTIEVAGEFTPPSIGEYQLGCSGVGAFSLEIDGEVVFDETLALVDSSDPIEALIRPPQRVHRITLDSTAPVSVRLRHRVDHASATSKVELDLTPPSAEAEADFERAVALASGADVAIVVVGTDAEVETESMDRGSLSLPGRQDDLVSRVAAANPRTIVVINSGAPVLAPWIDDVRAVVAAWFPGQEFGNALGDVISGTREPGGRLPLLWPRSWGAHQPSTTPIDGTLSYTEGLSIGHRSADRRSESLFPFGHGLGYTSWELDEPSVSWRPDGSAEMTVAAVNTGTRPGKHVAQIFASAPTSSVARPDLWLVGWHVVHAEPGERATATIIVPRRKFEHWDRSVGEFLLEKTTFTLSHSVAATDRAGRSVSLAPEE